MKEVYSVSECFDRSVKVIAYFTSKAIAQAMVDNFNKPGNMSSFHVDEPITVYDDLVDYAENNPAALREKALSKLTPEDREILGLR